MKISNDCQIDIVVGRHLKISYCACLKQCVVYASRPCAVDAIFVYINLCINGLCMLNLHHCMDTNEKQKKKHEEKEENVWKKGKKKRETNN